MSASARPASARLLDIFDYARAKYGCDQFVIDSLMRLGIAADDYTGQEKAVFQLVDWAVQHEVHLHLVAHSRKGERGQGAPETEDIKGAMEIGANAFNIMTVWRNRRHEEELQAAATEALRAEMA
jgi:twinkle protein